MTTNQALAVKLVDANTIKKLSIEDMQEIARKRKGKCLSDKYINNKTKLEWKCLNGHKWKAIPESIKSGNRWCPVCARKNKWTIN